MKYDFFKEAKLAHNDRICEQVKNETSLAAQAKREYSLFCVWCRMMNENPTEVMFKFYLKNEKVKLNFWVQKKLLETYFGYEYKFDYLTNKWLAKKNAG